MTTPVPPTTSQTLTGDPFNCSALALLALGLAQNMQLKGPMPEQAQQFSVAVDRLAHAPEFEIVAAEGAAELLKFKAAESDQLWSRFGLRSGTILTVLPLTALYFTSSTLSITLTSGLALVLALGALVAGVGQDPIQVELKLAEALFKSALKRKPQLSGASGSSLGIDLGAVASLVARKQNGVMRVALAMLVVTFVLTIAKMLIHP